VDGRPRSRSGYLSKTIPRRGVGVTRHSIGIVAVEPGRRLMAAAMLVDVPFQLKQRRFIVGDPRSKANRRKKASDLSPAHAGSSGSIFLFPPVHQ